MKKSLLKITALVSAGLLLAGCSSAGEETDTATDENTTPAAEVDFSEAQEIFDTYTQRPDTIVVDAPLSEPAPTGKNLYWVECALPACILLGDSLQEATDALGWNLKRVDAGTSPETVKSAWEQVVNATPEADAVIASGFPRDIFEDELAVLEERGVPAVNISTNDAVGGALIASLGTGDIRNVKVGELQAAATIVSGEGNPNAVYVYSSAFSSNPPQEAAFTSEMNRLCPDCSTDSYDAPITSIGTSLPADLTAYLQANPEVDHVVFSYGDMAIGFPAALAEIGMNDKIKVIVDTPGVIGSSHLADRDTFAYALAYPGADFIWQATDVILRSMIGEDISVSADAPPLQWIITPETVPSTTDDYPVVEDFQEQYKTLWNVN